MKVLRDRRLSSGSIMGRRSCQMLVCLEFESVPTGNRVPGRYIVDVAQLKFGKEVALIHFDVAVDPKFARRKNLFSQRLEARVTAQVVQQWVNSNDVDVVTLTVAIGSLQGINRALLIAQADKHKRETVS